MMKWLMSMVLPGVDDVLARSLRPVSMLMSDDLPTLERPMNAYSWRVPAGHLPTSVLLISNLALDMIMMISLFSEGPISVVGSYLMQMYKIFINKNWINEFPIGLAQSK